MKCKWERKGVWWNAQRPNILIFFLRSWSVALICAHKHNMFSSKNQVDCIVHPTMCLKLMKQNDRHIY
jgi:hypothetical protein